MTSPWRFALSWPLVLSKFHLHRVFTCFFFGGSGLKLLFDVFLIFRNSTDLELNHFGRRTAAYTWAHHSGLNDITTGVNGRCSTKVWCGAASGWDGPTGLGTPNGTSAF